MHPLIVWEQLLDLFLAPSCWTSLRRFFMTLPPEQRCWLDSQGCYQFLTPRVVAALKARTCKLALTLEEQRSESSRQHIKLLTEALRKLANCAAVKACKLGISKGPSLCHEMHFSPDLVQHLINSFPGLTSLALHGYYIHCSGLASLLAHPRLSLQLQQLDLSSTFITQPKRPKPGAATPANLFYGVRLQQLSLLVTKKAVGEDKPFLPDLRPLSQHLTQLCLQQREGVKWHLDKYTAALQPLAQLQVLTVSHTYHLQGLPGLLQALPRLHTLRLPHVGQDQLDALLAATQLTSIQLGCLEGLISSRADAPCSWQRLELTGFIDCSSAAHLPLHSLTQPLVLGALQCNANDLDLVAAAVNNLTQACKVPVMIKVLRLRMFVIPDTPAMAAQQLVELQQLMAVLQARKHCSWGMVSVTHMIVGAADVSTLAPFCQGCSHLQFKYGSLTPSLEFWRQLVQDMPTITHLTFSDVKGSASATMDQSLKLMADQPWARWLDIYISRYSDPEVLLACYRASPLSQPGKLRLDSQRCDQLLTPRVVTALQARTCQLALSLEQPQAQSSREYIRLLTEVLKKLANCAAVEACRLAFIQDPSHAPDMPLDCSRSLAQHLMDTFPGLTSLSLDKYAIPCSGLATLLSHPQLSLQLQQLDLSSTTILQAKRPEPGAATLETMFQASRLKQLSLSTQKMAWETEPLLPDLRPLSQHLTQLCLQQCGCVGCGLDKFIAILQPLTRLQVLTISQTCFLEGLPRLLRVLPHLHTLQLPDATVYGQEQLDSLLAATQLTSIQLNSLMGLTSSRADVPCSWQRLELTGDIGCSSAAHLPLHSLTQPLVLGELRTDYDNCKQVAAAAHNLTSCSVSVRIKVLHLEVAGLQHVKLQQLEASLQALNNSSWETVSVTHMNVGAANVATLAPLCQGCTKLEFAYSSLTPSLEFWRQLVQLMPNVTHLTFSKSDGSASAAMHQSLKRMAEQPWARWLDICIARHTYSDSFPASWRASPLSQPGKFRLHSTAATASAACPKETLQVQHIMSRAALLDDIAHRLVKGRETLARTCFGLFEAGLLHAPSFRLQLDRQCCDQLLSPRVIAGLRARECKLAITLEQPRVQGRRLLAEVLGRLGICTDVEACKLSSLEDSSLAPRTPMDCSPSLAQCLVESFPALTSLSLHNYAIPCSGLATLVAHPQLSLQLQQLDLSSTTILQAKRPEPGAATLATLFHASRLKQLSLLINMAEGENKPLLPNLQPLSQHLTQLCLQQQKGVVWRFDKFITALAPLAQLQVLAISNESQRTNRVMLAVLEVPLTRSHTLHGPTPIMCIRALKEADNGAGPGIESMMVMCMGISSGPSTFAHVHNHMAEGAKPRIHHSSCTLSQPQPQQHAPGDPSGAAHHEQGRWQLRFKSPGSGWAVGHAAAAAGPQQHHCHPAAAAAWALDMVAISSLFAGSAADVTVLAPLRQACTRIRCRRGIIQASLCFWLQLVQLMPAVQQVTFWSVAGAATEAMCESLRLMAGQPWARHDKSSLHLWTQRFDQFLTPRVVAALQARTCKLVLTLEQQRAQSSRQYIRLLTEVLQKLASCAAVDTCKLGTIQGPSLVPHMPLDCSSSLAQCLVDSFPCLTSLALHGYSISCSGLAALLSHPQLSLQLQQLDLSSTTILQAKRPEPGAATLASLFHASRLKQLSLLFNNMVEGENNPLLPNLQPLSQHLTQLCLTLPEGVVWRYGESAAALQPLAQLRVLTISCLYHLQGLPRLLQALPQLHTLQLPDAFIRGQREVDELLAVTQLTSIQLSSCMFFYDTLGGLTSLMQGLTCLPDKSPSCLATPVHCHAWSSRAAELEASDVMSMSIPFFHASSMHCQPATGCRVAGFCLAAQPAPLVVPARVAALHLLDHPSASCHVLPPLSPHGASTVAYAVQGPQGRRAAAGRLAAASVKLRVRVQQLEAHAALGCHCTLLPGPVSSSLRASA
ncbi:hypothetical protein V8C86DRAFT_3030992 [Haematococcus lacustris]